MLSKSSFFNFQEGTQVREGGNVDAVGPPVLCAPVSGGQLSNTALHCIASTVPLDTVCAGDRAHDIGMRLMSEQGTVQARQASASRVDCPTSCAGLPAQGMQVVVSGSGQVVSSEIRRAVALDRCRGAMRHAVQAYLLHMCELESGLWDGWAGLAGVLCCSINARRIL